MAAVGTERVSAVVGYQLSAGNFSTPTANLPQRVAVLSEANHANQSTLDVSEWQATSLKAVGLRYGFGSHSYLIARIMLPILGGIPLVFYPQAEAAGATSKVYTVTPIGTATANATHTLIIAGRTGLDAQFYNITVQLGDTSDVITGKITDALSNVLGCPFSVTDNDYINTLTSKVRGLTSEALTLSVDTNGTDAGISYGVNSIASGAGTPSIAAALALMDPVWNTIGINSYGTNATICSALEAWTGIPDPDSPTGRYVGTIMKPIVWLTGSVAEDPSSFTDPRAAQVALSISPTPLAKSLPMEGAASDGATWANIAQNKPALDVLNKKLIDIPAPISIGAMADYNERDRIVKRGCSTVNLINGNYIMIDPVTTYHPDGDLQPAFRYRRDLMVDFNIRFRYKVLEQIYVVGKVLAGDNDDVNTINVDVIKPKTWKQILATSLFPQCVSDGLISDTKFSVDSTIVGIDPNNAQRFNTKFNYKKTGIARIASTEVQSGFNTGTITI